MGFADGPSVVCRGVACILGDAATGWLWTEAIRGGPCGMVTDVSIVLGVALTGRGDETAGGGNTLLVVFGAASPFSFAGKTLVTLNFDVFDFTAPSSISGLRRSERGPI